MHSPAFPVPSALLESEAASSAAFEGPDLTRYLLVCALLVLAIVGLGILIQRFFLQGLRARAANRSLQILDVLPLARKSRLMVVRCYDKSFLIGVAEKSLTCIAELDADEAGLPDPVPDIPSLARAERSAPAPRTDFAELVRGARGTGEAGTPADLRARGVTRRSQDRNTDRGRGILG